MDISLSFLDKKASASHKLMILRAIGRSDVQVVKKTPRPTRRAGRVNKVRARTLLQILCARSWILSWRFIIDTEITLCCEKSGCVHGD